MTHVVRFEIRHFDEIKLREPDRTEVESIPCFRKLFEVYEQTGGAYTLLSPEGVVSIAGVFPIWPGVATAWMLTSDLVKKYPKAFFKATKEFLAAISIDWKLHRVQASVNSENLIAINWMRHLGFEQEGVMRGYGPDGKDYLMCGRRK